MGQPNPWKTLESPRVSIALVIVYCIRVRPELILGFAGALRRAFDRFYILISGAISNRSRIFVESVAESCCSPLSASKRLSIDIAYTAAIPLLLVPAFLHNFFSVANFIQSMAVG